MPRAKLCLMGRPRKTPSPYPKRCYAKGGQLYFVETRKEPLPDGRGKSRFKNIWHPLGALSDLGACYKKLAEVLGERDPKRKTIQKLWESYEREELIQKAPKTQRGRRNDMKWPLTVFGAMTAEQIEPHHIWTFWRKRGQTEQARHEIRALSALLTYARQCGARTKENPCYDLKLPGAKPRSLYVTDAMFYAVHDGAPVMIQRAMELAWCGGLDEGTIRTLERRNLTATGLDFDRTKTSKAQAVDGEDLIAIVRAALAEPPQLRRFVICRRDGQAFTANGFQTAWQRAVAKAIESGRLAATDRYHFHDLRAKGASEKATDEEAKALLGHGDKGVTVRHYRRLPQRSVAVKIFKEQA